jgi:hypothetical protein
MEENKTITNLGELARSTGLCDAGVQKPKSHRATGGRSEKFPDWRLLIIVQFSAGLDLISNPVVSNKTLS